MEIPSNSTYQVAAAAGKSLARSGHNETLQEVFDAMSRPAIRTLQWAAAVVHHCGELNPKIFNDFVSEMIAVLRAPKHPAAPRAILRTFTKMDIPRKWHGTLTNLSFAYLTDPMAPVAHKVYAMALLSRFALDYPDLLGELKAAIQFQYPTSSAGFKSRAKHIAKLHGFHPEKD